MKNRKNTVAAWVAATLLLTGAEAFATPSGQVLVDGDLRSAHWTTVFTNAVNLAWDWSTNATKAQLDITDISGTTYTTNFTKDVASNYIWQVFASDVPEEEDVYILTLTFRTAGDVIVGALTSRLAVVTGAFGAAAIDAVEASRAWQKVDKNVVIPYDASYSTAATNAASAQLVIAKQGGAVETNTFADVAGYYGWKLRNSGWGYGTFGLLLTFTGTTSEWSATLTRLPDGTMFRLQ